MRKSHKVLIGILILGCSLLVTGCLGDKTVEPFRDAPRSKTVNELPADVIEMPDGFNNLATKCDHGNRIYATFHSDDPYGSVAVVPNDPSCVGQ